MARRLRILVATVALVGVFTSVAAVCAPAPEDEQMACCPSGQHSCEPSETAIECCAAAVPSSPQATIIKADSSATAVRALLLTLSAAPPLVRLSSPQLSTLDSIPPRERLGSSPPAYIAFSALLI